MAAAQGAGWRAPMRLRQLESVAGRGLLLGAGSKQQAPAAHYVTLAARCPSALGSGETSGSGGEEEWSLVYRSEAVGGTSNPEWRPLTWGEHQLLQHDPLLDSGSVQLLLALHALEPAAAAVGPTARQGTSATRAAGAAGAAGAAAALATAGAAGAGQPAGGLGSPVLFATAARPVLQLPAARLPHNSGTGPGSRAASVADEALEPAPPEAPGQPLADGRGVSAAEAEGSGELPAQQFEPRRHQQGGELPPPPPPPPPQQQPQQNGMHRDGPAEPEQQQQQQEQQPADTSGQPPQQGEEQQGQQPPASPGQADKFAAAAAAETAAAEPAAAAAAAGPPAAAAAGPAAAPQPVPDAWMPAAAAALAATGACPGRLVAAWRLGGLSELFPGGADLAALRQPLQPNTLVLSFGSAGLWLCPPPLQEAAASTAPPSLQASPLKRSQLPSASATAGEERAEGGAPGPGRRFASLLVSKLLRSTANLQEAGALGSHADLAAELAGASSDAESDAGSDATGTTATTRRTTATAPGEAAGPGAAAGAAAAGTVQGSSGGGSSRAVGAAASGMPGGSSVATKALTLASAHQCVSSLVALQSRLRDLAGRSQALQQQLAQWLGPEQQRRQQNAALAALADEAARCRRQAAEVQQQVADVQAAAAAAKKQATVRAQALVTVLKVMTAADRRVSEAEAALRGEEGRGALTAVLRELVARRCQMVCQLGATFQMGPTAVSIPQAPPGGFLEERLERQWAGAATSEDGSSPGTLALAAAAGPGRYGSSSFGLDGFNGGGDGPSKYRQEMRLSIGGLEVRPSVWRKAFDDGGYESDAAEDRAAGVALGYVAQMVDRLAAYLDVPLRYPLALRGSRSAVIDSYPPAGTWAEVEEEGCTRRPLFGRSGGDAAAAAAAAAQRVEYPLYCDSNRERPRFAVGVFLLNKDVIQLLQAHGISAAGPNHLLHNLHKLLAAAQSGLPARRALPAG